MTAACGIPAEGEGGSWADRQAPAGPDRAVRARQKAALALEAALSTDDAAEREILRRRAAALISSSLRSR